MPRTLPLRISIRDCLILVLLVIFNTIHITDMANNNMDIQSDKKPTKEVSGKVSHGEFEDYMKSCPFMDHESVKCSTLQYPCISCNRSIDCNYGGYYNYSCVVKPKVLCNYLQNLCTICNTTGFSVKGNIVRKHACFNFEGSKTFNRTAMCRYCYQTEKWEHRCDQKANCNSLASPLKYYTTNCTVSDDVICLGHRKFLKRIRCSWTAGTRWGTALILALTLGGFGADRFYLGHWQEGIGKLFSFGGLGVWTLVDALLIGIHHLGPADGSLYI